MDEMTFIKQNGKTWRSLENEVKFFNKKMSLRGRIFSSKTITKERVDNFIVLYNKTANDLSYCRTYLGENETAAYLNKLVALAHPVIYRRKSEPLKALFTYLISGFPRLIRQYSAIVLIATALLFLSLLFAFIYTAVDYENVFAFIEPAVAESLRPSDSEINMSTQDMSGLAIYLFSNNVQVSIYAFAGGLTLGIFTIYLLIVNGLTIGALAGVALHRGQLLYFISMIMPHGVTELFAIIIAGAAGLLTGYAVINPGKISRRDALILRGRDACKLFGGTIPLLIISALIEAFITPQPFKLAIKYLIIIVMALLLALYIFLPGRSQSRKQLTNRVEKNTRQMK